MGNEKETEVGSKQHTVLLNRIKNQLLVCAISPFHYLICLFFNCTKFQIHILACLSPAVYILSIILVLGVQPAVVQQTEGAEAECPNQSGDGAACPFGTGVSFICWIRSTCQKHSPPLCLEPMKGLFPGNPKADDVLWERLSVLQLLVGSKPVGQTAP